ncbi:hypothetical protein GHK92_10755 [Nocardioides sp. dk4132]|uniref:hypothetical protein n=1 Tax=unclassified Nocardioides TaxID=2615069 RepID=UPI001295F53F|nr:MULTISPECIES: hypothetical protein [unclassified Nocardioides]MQW76357.1 hypothetical protein [Nocardioides sp. dk4132]QGA07365.1 hypothetical protein GFH29_08165 [Nocardioides sp. dk884]
MSLVVAIMDEQPAGSFRGAASWGEWQVHPLSDPTALATDPQIRSPHTRHLLVLAPTAHAMAAHVAASTVAAARPELPVRVLSFPVSAAVLVRAAELVPADTASATAVYDAILAALDTVVWGAWLPSVARLSRPAPTLGQHVQSWFAGADGFLAVHGDPGWVAKLPIAELAPERRLRRVPTPGVVAASFECHAYGELPEAAISALFAMGLATRPTRREPVADVARAWGSAKAVEFVISWPAAPGAAGTPTSLRCPSCEEPVRDQICPFCRIAAEGVDRTEGSLRGVAR